jgi:hypothetical protein
MFICAICLLIPIHEHYLKQKYDIMNLAASIWKDGLNRLPANFSAIARLQGAPSFASLNDTQVQ